MALFASSAEEKRTKPKPEEGELHSQKQGLGGCTVRGSDCECGVSVSLPVPAAIDFLVCAYLETVRWQDQ